jgi:Fuc2NAc and GlcNAc transferase
MAYIASQKYLMPELTLLIAYIPLIVLAVYYKAGNADYDQ